TPTATPTQTPTNPPTATPSSTPTATPTPCSYVERDTTSDCLAEAGGSGHQLLTTTGAPASLTRTLGSTVTDDVTFAFTADAANLADWGTGPYTVELNVTAARPGIHGSQAPRGP